MMETNLAWRPSSLYPTLQRAGKVLLKPIFRCNAAAAEKPGAALELRARGRLRIKHKEYQDPAALLPPTQMPHDMHSISEKDFYEALETLDYEYSGSFRALCQLRRRLSASSGVISNFETTDLVLHPAILDAAFQSVFVAHSEPYDGEMWSLHVPKSIQNVSINPRLCAKVEMEPSFSFPFDCIQPEESDTITGDISKYTKEKGKVFVQIEGLVCVPLPDEPNSNHSERELFSTVVWDVASPDPGVLANKDMIPGEQKELAHILERMAVFYLGRLHKSVPEDHQSRFTGEHVHLYKFARHILAKVGENNAATLPQEWLNDSIEQIERASWTFDDIIDVRLLKTIGAKLPQIAMGELSAIELGMKENMLSQYYEEGLGFPRFTRRLAQTVKQMVHRYPNLHILEIGAGTGGATKGVLQEIGDCFASYTYTDVSAGFFENAKTTFAERSDKMKFKVLDAGLDPIKQGFQEGSYDLILASMVLHATPNLNSTMENIRRLLKPGGYLIAFEGYSNDVARLGVSFGGFPGWWIGADQDGRILSPFLNKSDWHDLLIRTGFSGCDKSTNNGDLDDLVHPYFVFASQAVDDCLTLLNEPKSELKSEVAPFIDNHILILGNDIVDDSALLNKVSCILRPNFRNMTICSSLSQVPLDLPKTTLLLGLADILSPSVLSELNDSSLVALKRALQGSAHVFWVGSRSSPHSNMILGLLRSLVRELSTFSYQHLLLDESLDADPNIIANAFVSLHTMLHWQSSPEHQPTLVTIEPEVFINSEGSWMIPRLIANRNMNNRYISSRKPIKSTANVNRDTVSLAVEDGMTRLYQDAVPSSGNKNGRYIRVCYSLVPALRVTGLEYLHLVCGFDRETGQKIVALSPKNATSIFVPEQFCVKLHVKCGKAADYLAQIASHLITSVLFDTLTSPGLVLVHEPDAALASVMATSAHEIGLDIIFSTTNGEERNITYPHILLHHNSSKRAIKSKLPKNVSLFVDLASCSKDNDSMGAQIRSLLPPQVRCETRDTLLACESFEPLNSNIEKIALQLQQAVHGANAPQVTPSATPLRTPPASTQSGTRSEYIGPINYGECCPEMFKISDLQDQCYSMPWNSIVDWTSTDPIPVKVQPIDSQVSFLDEKTYWLAGMTGSMGKSLVEWMTRHGGRYFVLSSRDPVVDQQWLDKMAEDGATVGIVACDMTNREQLWQLYCEMSSTLPPLAGVAQGAMVLRDMEFNDMTMDAWADATRPKVEGTMYLNQVLQDADLDFFICFSSISSITGAVGQSNYAAANTYMAGVIEERRRQGLPGSIINIGPVLGVGYISETAVDLKGLLQSGSYMCTSERDFHHLFAEAVLAGYPDSNCAMEITSGLARITQDEELRPAWASTPFMSHHIQRHDNSSSERDTTEATISVTTQLENALTTTDTQDIILKAFLVKIASLYQLDSQALLESDPSTMHLDAMGTDSLLAVEIRAWFRQTTHVDIPVLKILNGASVADLTNMAASAVRGDQIKGSVSVQTTSEKLAQEITQPEAIDILSSPSSCAIDSSSRSSSPLSIETRHSSPPLEGVGSRMTKSPMATLDPNLRTASLSMNQSMYWFVMKFLDDPTGLNHTGAFHLQGSVQVNALKEAVQSVGRRHEALRTAFWEKDGKPTQTVMDDPTVGLQHRYIQTMTEVEEQITNLQGYSFDMAQGETYRLVLLSRSSTDHYLLFSTHSMMADGLSLQVFLKDLEAFYVGKSPASSCYQYLDHANTQQRKFRDKEFDPYFSYWSARLEGLLSPAPLMSISKLQSRPVMRKYANHRADITIPSDMNDSIRLLCREYRVTPFHFYLTVLRALIIRFSKSQDFAIGIADANRDSDELMTSIGPYLNLVPLRFRDNISTAHFNDMLKEAKETTFQGLLHSKIPFQIMLDR